MNLDEMKRQQKYQEHEQEQKYIDDLLQAIAYERQSEIDHTNQNQPEQKKESSRVTITIEGNLSPEQVSSIAQHAFDMKGQVTVSVDRKPN